MKMSWYISPVIAMNKEECDQDHGSRMISLQRLVKDFPYTVSSIIVQISKNTDDSPSE